MSWLMSSVVMPVSALSSASRSTMRDWMVASSPVVGSSAMRSEGSAESAIAIMARWHMPPDMPKGKLSKRSLGESMRTRSSQWIARSLASLSRFRFVCRRMVSTSCFPIVE